VGVAKRKISPERLARCEQLREELPARVAEYARRSAAAAAELAALLSRAGVTVPELTSDPVGLARLEELLFDVARGELEAPREQFEAAAAFFFAQCLIAGAGAKWDIHDVCTEKWSPYVILFAGDRKLGVENLVSSLYAKGTGRRPKRNLSKLLAALSGA
jgi:hypothetical protein